MQNELTTPKIIPGPSGTVDTFGWARRDIFEFSRKNVKTSGFKIKEWDSYIFMNEEAAVSFMISDLGFMGSVSVSFTDIKTGLVRDKTELVFMPRGRRLKLGNRPSDYSGEWHNSKMDMIFKKKADGTGRIICNYRDFVENGNLAVDLDIFDNGYESVNVISEVKDKPENFFLNVKKNHLSAEGTITVGDRNMRFSEGELFGTYNFGRGAGDFDHKIYWGNANGHVNGKTFGINIGYWLTEKEDVTENAVLYDGKIHKLDKVGILIPGKTDAPDYMKTWEITDNEGRFKGKFTPLTERNEHIDLKFLLSEQHEFFGTLSGKAVLDDKETIEFENCLCVFEILHNKF